VCGFAALLAESLWLSEGGKNIWRLRLRGAAAGLVNAIRQGRALPQESGKPQNWTQSTEAQSTKGKHDVK